MDAERILIILLSVVLIAFLLVATIFILNLIKISRRVDSLTEKVDIAAGNMASASEAFRKVATPLAVSGLVSSVVGKVFKSKRGKGRAK